MKAAVLREVRTPLQIEEVSIGKPGPHEVLIRTAAAGVCHSDPTPCRPCWATRAPALSSRSVRKSAP